MIQNLEMSYRLPPNKSLIGSFTTHDDKSPMSNGGVPYCNLTTGIQATLPMTNPYFVTGFESGDRYIYSYKDKLSTYSDTECRQTVAHSEQLDIFNYSRMPGGDNPEIGKHMAGMMKLRKQYEDVLTRGSYIPLKVKGNQEDLIIAYARHLNGKTVVVIANKDVNARQKGQVQIPGLKRSQALVDLSPAYGLESKYTAKDNAVTVDLGPARFHMFEIDDKNIEEKADKVYRQNMQPDTCVTFNKISDLAVKNALALYSTLRGQ